MSEQQLINQIKLIFDAKGVPDYISLRFVYRDTKGREKEVYLRLAS